MDKDKDIEVIPGLLRLLNIRGVKLDFKVNVTRTVF